MISWTTLIKKPLPKKVGHSPHNKKYSIDYFMDNFISTGIDEQGLPHHTLSGPRMVHYSDNDVIDVTTPYIVFYQKDVSPKWSAISERGLTKGNSDRIFLVGKVVIHQLDENGIELDDMTIFTRNVRIELEKEYAETSQPTTMFSPSGRTDSVGARLYFNEDRVELISQVKGDYVSTGKP
ncbi:LPS export ABC transporter periplasmic protein LptC [Candidatus Nitrosacidococcus sp. I8]|uniref:LPS export ABC transporter periplasmic protein LptC n=1 Tax=Candidatus Nitrosacidococcus sp. I8 TaxID=2942908 RepID=UPI002226A877|nr:LPS export ABC transporter periplasmic protein LptC [Candidatus Nitrosacidococcus sp. I8]